MDDAPQQFGRRHDDVLTWNEVEEYINRTRLPWWKKLLLGMAQATLVAVVTLALAIILSNLMGATGQRQRTDHNTQTLLYEFRKHRYITDCTLAVPADVRTREDIFQCLVEGENMKRDESVKELLIENGHLENGHAEGS